VRGCSSERRGFYRICLLYSRSRASCVSLQVGCDTQIGEDGVEEIVQSFTLNPKLGVEENLQTFTPSLGFRVQGQANLYARLGVLLAQDQLCQCASAEPSDNDTVDLQQSVTRADFSL
jgi:hypothetical protein